jgi:ribonuclease HI
LYRIKNSTIEIFTDGSFHPQTRIGAWVAILFIDSKKITLSDTVNDTTNNRMELTAVIKAIEFAKEKHQTDKIIHIISDSQYVIGLIGRQEKFAKLNFKTITGNDIKNVDLVRHFLKLNGEMNIHFTKIKAHQQQTSVINYNIKADILARHLVREAVAKTNFEQ